MSLADYYRKNGNKEKAFEELKLGFANPNLDIDTKVNILLNFYSINQLYTDLKEQAFELSKILVETHPSIRSRILSMEIFFYKIKICRSKGMLFESHGSRQQ